MLKRSFSAILLLVVFSSPNFCQKFMQGTGITAHFMFGKSQTTNSSSSFYGTYSKFTYFPRYNLLEQENTSLSVSLLLGAGVGLETELFTNKSRITFAYDVSPVLDYNIGCKSTRTNSKHFGGYVGAGFLSPQGLRFSDPAARVSPYCVFSLMP